MIKKSKIQLIFLGVLFNTMAVIPALSQAYPPFTDTSHFSQVFGHDKFYRLYLPKGYESSGKRYPVIYFFHGWGGRHFKDDNALLNYEGIKLLVDKYQVILVMWDGNIDTTEPRPYNVGYHNDIKFEMQEKDYFPELVSHIDSSYRTLSDRQHRGIIGFSMGGFMSFFLAGKYPDKINAAVSLAGSPEFFVGYPDNHTLYPVRYTFKNLSDVKIRMHNGDSDILYYLNDEVKEGAKWEGIKLDYWKFHGGHMVDKTGETIVFEKAMKFITDAFSEPSECKPGWSHYDLYPAFTVWNYEIKTGKKEPGYLFMKKVDKTGFGFYTRRWLPLGPPLPLDSIFIKTAPLYDAGKEYHVVTYQSNTGTSCAVILLLAICVLSFFTFEKQLQEQENIALSYTILNKLQSLQALLVDMETGRRGFAVTGDSAFLEPYKKAKYSLPLAQRDLQALVQKDDAELRGGLAKLDIKIAALAGYWQQSIAVHAADDKAHQLRYTLWEKERMPLPTTSVILLPASGNRYFYNASGFQQTGTLQLSSDADDVRCDSAAQRFTWVMALTSRPRTITAARR